MNTEKWFGLREAATALGIIPMNASKWLADSGLTNGRGSTRKLSLDRVACVFLLVCQRLSSLGQLNFTDQKITDLLHYIIGADAALEVDLRSAKVATLIGESREVALSSSEEAVLYRHQPPFQDRIKWYQDAIAVSQLCYSTFSLGPLYDQVDKMFLSEQELAEKNDPWLKFGVKAEAK